MDTFIKKEYALLFVLSCFLLVIIAIESVAAIDSITGELVSGKAASQQMGVVIFIGPSMPVITIISPESKTYITNYSLLLNYTATNANETWYNLDSGTNITITSPTRFNTSQGSHTLYLYANNSNGLASKNVTFLINSSLFTILYEEYRGAYKGISTDFIQIPYEGLQSLSNILLENTLYGKILFNQAINTTSDENFADRVLNLDSNTNISFSKIELNSTALPNFNTPATIWLYNLTFANPRILINGQQCPANICTFESYSSGIFKFNVTGFSGSAIYTVEETSAAEAAGKGAEKGCLTDWNCTEWNTCINGKQSRVCTKTRPSCTAIANRPEEIRGCEIGKVPVPEEKPAPIVPEKPAPAECCLAGICAKPVVCWYYWPAGVIAAAAAVAVVIGIIFILNRLFMMLKRNIIYIDKKKINIELKPGETKQEELKITNRGTGNPEVDLATDLKGFITISENKFDLKQNATKSLILKFKADKDAPPGLYSGKLIAIAGSAKKEILIRIKVV